MECTWDVNGIYPTAIKQGVLEHPPFTSIKPVVFGHRCFEIVKMPAGLLVVSTCTARLNRTTWG